MLYYIIYLTIINVKYIIIIKLITNTYGVDYGNNETQIFL